VLSQRNIPAKPSLKDTMALLNMLFASGTASRVMIGFFSERQITSSHPPERSSHGMLGNAEPISFAFNITHPSF